MMNGDPQELLREVQSVREHVAAKGEQILRAWQPMLSRGAFHAGAANLAHYLAFRELDLRPLQQKLVHWGLSGLGRSEARVLPTLDAVIANLQVLGGTDPATVKRPTADEFFGGGVRLQRHANELFDDDNKGRETSIMVTMSAKAAKNPDMARELIAAGMDVARINCAHDGPTAWARMIAHVKAAAQEVGRRCPVLMDLQGPKIRTRSVITPEDNPAVEAGDHILITFEEPRPRREFPFQASCAMPDVLRQVQAGARVSIKDGLIVGHVEQITDDGLVVAVRSSGSETIGSRASARATRSIPHASRSCSMVVSNTAFAPAVDASGIAMLSGASSPALNSRRITPRTSSVTWSSPSSSRADR